MRTDSTGTVPEPTTTGPLGPQRLAQLHHTMAAAAAGDRAAPWALLEGFGDEIAATLHALARRDGLRLGPDDVESLAADACVELARVAGSWRPDGGALPWTYARGRLRALLHREAGPPLAALPPVEVADARNWGDAPPADDDTSLAVLERVATGGEPAAVALHEALASACTPADGELVLRYLQQKAAGDPSPSQTVGRQLGRRPDAVRQAFRRSRTRLRRLALAEHRYRPLLALPFLAEEPGGAATERAA